MSASVSPTPHDADHLQPAVRRMLDLPVADRIAYVRHDKWLEYPAASAALRAMSDLLEKPNQTRMRGVLVSARPNNGKSAVFRRFRAQNRVEAIEGGLANMPVALVWAPDEPSEAKLWSQVLKSMKTPHRSSDSARHLREQAINTMEILNVRMLMFDELHNLLNGSALKTQQMLTLLKMLVNEQSVRIAVAGTQDVVRALSVDHQLATRFDAFPLPPWKEDRMLLTMLRGLESVMPLPEPSGLATKEMVDAMLPHAKSTIGGFVVQVQAATELALKAGLPRIDVSLVKKAQRNSGTDLKGVASEI